MIVAERGRELALEPETPSKPGSFASTQVSARPPAIMGPVEEHRTP